MSLSDDHVGLDAHGASNDRFRHRKIPTNMRGDGQTLLANRAREALETMLERHPVRNRAVQPHGRCSFDACGNERRGDGVEELDFRPKGAGKLSRLVQPRQHFRVGFLDRDQDAHGQYRATASLAGKVSMSRASTSS